MKDMRKGIARLLLVAALGFLCWSGYAYWTGDSSSTADRDRALTLGSRAVATLNTLDRARPEVSVDQWLAVTSGPLHDQLKRDGAGQAANSATGTVTAAAFTSYKEDAATLIASVNVQLTPPSGAPTVQRQRFEAALSRAGGDWKLTSLTAVPVGAR
jgi:Mce-associated membrane protein